MSHLLSLSTTWGLCTDSYRLILSHPAYLAGLILARSGKSECKPCIAGLRQYSIAFGHLWELAEEVEGIYQSTISRAQSMKLPPIVPSGSGGSMSVNHLLSSPAVSGGISGVSPDWSQERGEGGEWNVPGAGAHLVSCFVSGQSCQEGRKWH